MKSAILASAFSLAFATSAFALAPDLVPDFDVATGKVTVKNAGDGAALKSVVTIKCKRRKPPVVGGGGGCPDLDPRLAANYINPAFPDTVAVNVPPLAPGASYSHIPSFFGSLVFPSGAYAFTIKADAGAAIAESNETNNIVIRTKFAP